jgi:transcriptional regulator with XRE-family HTH domain
MTPPATVADVFRDPGTLATPRRDEPRWRFVLPAVVAGSTLASPTSVLGTGSRVQSAEAVVALQAHILQTGTQSAHVVDAAAALGRDYAATVRQLQQRSGLTWGEVARSLGVSRRAVHHWASGKRVSDRHAKRIEELATLVNNHASATPDMTRGRLLALRPDGRSALGVFEDESRPRGTASLSTLSVREFLEAETALQPAPMVRSSRPSRVSSRVIPRRGQGDTKT